MTAEPATSQCPFSVSAYPCDKKDCDGCAIKIEALAKENEQIANNMRSYWANLNNESA